MDAKPLGPGLPLHPQGVSHDVAVTLERQLRKEETAKVFPGLCRVHVGEVLASASKEAHLGQALQGQEDRSKQRVPQGEPLLSEPLELSAQACSVSQEDSHLWPGWFSSSFRLSFLFQLSEVESSNLRGGKLDLPNPIRAEGDRVTAHVFEETRKPGSCAEVGDVIFWTCPEQAGAEP